MQILHKLPTTQNLPLQILFPGRHHCGGVPRQLGAGHAVPPVGHPRAGNHYPAGVCPGQRPAHHFDEDYFDHLLSEIQEIRAIERRFYQKITDIYATAVDTRWTARRPKTFFATVQNKMHYAVHGSTAAEVIVERADHTKDTLGLTSWRNAAEGKIVKADVSVAKNYLSKGEMQELNEIVTMYLDYAARQARRHIPMTMADWAAKLDAFYSSTMPKCCTTKAK